MYVKKKSILKLAIRSSSRVSQKRVRHYSFLHYASSVGLSWCIVIYYSISGAAIAVALGSVYLLTLLFIRGVCIHIRITEYTAGEGLLFSRANWVSDVYRLGSD